MPQRPNARLTPRGRETLVSRIEPSPAVADIDCMVTGDGSGHRRGEFNTPIESGNARHVRTGRSVPSRTASSSG